MSKWTDADTSGHSGDSSSKVSSAEHDARDHATSEGTVQKTVSVSVGAIPPAKSQQGFGILFLVPKSDVHKKGMSILIPFLSSMVVFNEINENG